MFLKTSSAHSAKSPHGKKENIPSVIADDIHILGNIVSDGNVDFDGTLDGNIRCETLTIRARATIKGEAVATNVMVYGRVKGLIRAKNVQLFASCNVEGIIMHETISIEDGAFIDGKFKRTDKLKDADEEETSDTAFPFDSSASPSSGGKKILDTIRLIR